IAAAARQGGLWTSSDGGKTWQEGAGTQFQNWSCIQLSADGHRLAATESAGGLWINDLKIQVSNGSTLSAPVASSIGSTQYQWFKDGVVIRGATSATFNPASGLLYTGSYTVRLTTTTGSKVIYTETSSPMLLEHVDASMLIYKLTATGTTYTGKIKSNSAVTGYLILDRGRQRGGLIWRQTFGKQSTHSLELLENLHTRYTTSIPQGQMVISDLSDGLKDNADASALWLNGSITVITLRKTVPNLVGLQVLAPATLSGHSNLALNEGSTDPTTWQIETTAVKASLDTLETMATATYGRQDTVEAIMQRISQTLTLAGSILRASD
ncbi:MAG: hypothetical protein NTV80_08270, partial [Verrucomicrobia bacterium]|nr:hypothetical protein [Verrucomicrobiota bacterium]